MVTSEKRSEDRESKRHAYIWNKLSQAKGTMKIPRKEGFE